MSSSKNNVVKMPRRRINWFVIAMLAVVLIGGWTLMEHQLRRNAINEDMVAASQRLQEATATNQQLKEEREKLSDNAYIEKLAREELGMTKQGELPYIYAEKK